MKREQETHQSHFATFFDDNVLDLFQFLLRPLRQTSSVVNCTRAPQSYQCVASEPEIGSEEQRTFRFRIPDETISLRFALHEIFIDV